MLEHWFGVGFRKLGPFLVETLSTLIFENGFLPDFSPQQKSAATSWREALVGIHSWESLPPLPEGKTFKPKYNLPVLQNYKDLAPSWYWAVFPSNLVQPAISTIDADNLRAAALSARFPDRKTLNSVYEDLKYGARIGCKDDFRKPSKSTNAPSALDYGQHVSDSIADWLHKGFVYGPIPMHEVPASAKFNGLMTRPKPNGSVRIILNLSSPMGSCVNEGIDKADFPTTMSTTTDWLRTLQKAGRRARFCKIDWSDAYKHVAVHEDDTNLQWFEWCGMAFKELCLIFGGVSSAGIFDRLNKIVIYIACSRSQLDHSLVCQVLDDCCAAGPEHSSTIDEFDRVFRELATELGIKLAPRDDPEKSFAPCYKGVVLGIEYDTINWTWSLPEQKYVRLLHSIKTVTLVDVFQQEGIWSLTGKLLNIKPLIPCGRFNLNHVLKANSYSTDRTAAVPITPALKKQLHFWFTMIQVCAGKGSLPDPDAALPPWSIDVFTDAAGGSRNSVGLGVGAVTDFWWTYAPWSKAINFGHQGPNGKSLARSLSALELVGPLLTLASGFAWCKNTSVKIWVDNAGSVFIWKKGYSTSCDLSTTLVKAISYVATGLGCNVDLVKISRCSTPLAEMADALSKAAFPKFWSMANSFPRIPHEPGWVPPALMKWLANPIYDEDLGHRILLQVAQKTSVIGYNC